MLLLVFGIYDSEMKISSVGWTKDKEFVNLTLGFGNFKKNILHPSDLMNSI